MIVLKSMEQNDLSMVCEQVFPELKQKGFFTSVNGVEFYYAGLLEKRIECCYKSFYDEYDYAFGVKCKFSLCDYKKESRWIRAKGHVHIYNSPLLKVVDRYEWNASPEQSVSRLRNHYRANTLILQHYTHPSYSTQYLKDYLDSHGIYFIDKTKRSLAMPVFNTESALIENDLAIQKSVA